MAIQIMDEIEKRPSKALGKKDGPKPVPPQLPYVGAGATSKSLGSGTPGLNVAYHNSKHPHFWDHYAKDQAGAIGPVSAGGENLLAHNMLVNSKNSGPQAPEDRAGMSSKRATDARGKLEGTINSMLSHHMTLTKSFVMDVKERDLRRADHLRRYSMLTDAEIFEDVMTTTNSAHKAVAQIRQASDHVERAQHRINTRTCAWYKAAKKLEPVSQPQFILRSVIMNLCKRGIELDENLFLDILEGVCGSPAYQRDGHFQVFVHELRHVLEIDPYWFRHQLVERKLLVPDILSKEIIDLELARDAATQDSDEASRASRPEDDIGDDLCDALPLERPDGYPDTLEVVALEASRLLAADIDGTSDPFVLFWCAQTSLPKGTFPPGAPRKYTSHVPNSLDPVWKDEEVIEFSVSDEFEGLSAAVYDYDEVGDNEIMAYCRIGMNVIRSHGGFTERWFALEPPPAALEEDSSFGARATSYGEIKLRLHWFNRAQRDWDLANGIRSRAYGNYDPAEDARDSDESTEDEV